MVRAGSMVLLSASRTSPCRRRPERLRVGRQGGPLPSDRRLDGHPDARARRARRAPTHPRRRRGCAGPELTTFDLDEYIFGAVSAGASAFVLKDDPLKQLIAAIRTVAGGDALLLPAVTKRVIRQFARTSRVPPPTSSRS
jgi:DNA-binding NarL/FixJ family response regulator